MSNLKHLILPFFLLGALGHVQAESGLKDACADCQAEVTKLTTFLSSDSVIAAEIAFFLSQVCPYEQSPKDCETEVTKRWSNMSKALFKEPHVSELTCQKLELCPQTFEEYFFDGLVADDLCNNCTAGIEKVGKLLADPDIIKQASTFFDGPGYCSAQGTPDPDGCKKFVETFVPDAFPWWGKSIELAKIEICKDVFGVCS